MSMSNPEIDEDGNKFWYNEQGKLHRVDGPAIKWWNGDKAWWSHGKLHREDGPAVEWANGDKEWYLNDKEYTEEEFALIQFMNGVNVYV